MRASAKGVQRCVVERRTRPASREGRRWRRWPGHAIDSAGRSLKTKLTAGPTVSDAVSRREGARSAHETGWAGLRAEFLGRSRQSAVFFFFLCKFWLMFEFV